MMYGSSIFFGIRFFLAGFTPQQILEYKSRILSEGGVIYDEYSPDCTHVVVHNIAFDDPICVTARRDKKTLVTIIWLKDSLRYGEPIGIGNIMYRPLKDLNGIPGANKLVICLTGYQGMDREDMKTMVQLMGAQISKPLVVSTVTHLICYKFEGEKYELAKKMNVTKVVNHRWLVDCLEAWKILPEEPYSSRSGYELDMEAEAKDSEDEVEDISGRYNNGITIMQNEMGKAHSHFVIARNLPDPSTQQGFSHNDEKLLQSDNSDFDNVKFDNVDEQRAAFPPSNQTGNGHPSTYENPKNAGDFDAENFNRLKRPRKTPQKTALPLHVEEGLGNTIGSLKAPLSSRKTPRSGASLQTAGKSGKSGGRSKDKSTKMIIEDMPTFNLDIDKAEVASGFLGEPSSKRHVESDASKLNSLKSRKSPSKSSLSLLSPGKLSNQDGKLEIPLAEKVITDVCTSNIGSDQGKATSEFRASSAEKANLFDENDPGALLPQKRTSDGASHSTPKSQKLTSSASKRVDASEPRTSVNSSHEKRSSGALNSGCQIGDEFATPSAGRSSPNISSSKLKAKTVASSRSLAFEMLQGGEPMNTDSPTIPLTNSVSTSPVVGNNNGQPQTLQKDADTSPGTNDLEAARSGNLELNSTDQNDIPKPSRKKMVARKTLGSKSKVCRRSADVQRSSACKDSFRDDAAIHSAGQENKEPPTASPAADKVFVPPAVEESNGLGSKPHLGTESTNFATLLDDETEAPPELNVDNEPLAAEQSNLVKSKSGEASGMLIHQIDGQGMPVAATVGIKKNLISQKGLAVKARKKSLLAAKEAAEDADEAEAGKVKEQVVGAAAKKRHGTLLLNKSKRPVEAGKEIEPISYDRVEVGREHELDCYDQYENKGGKHSGKLAGKNRRGTLLSNRSKGHDEVDNENNLVVDCDDGQNGSKNCPADLAAPSNMTLDNLEIKRKNETGGCNDQGTSKVSKCSGMLKMSDGPAEAEMENEPVLDGGQYPGKKVGAPVILDSSMEVDKENEPILATNLDTSKGVKRAGKLAGKKRGGTLVLNKSEGQVNEENKNKPDLHDEVTEKLTSKSNLTVNESDAVKGGKRAGKLVGKKRRGTLVIDKSEVQVNEGSGNKFVLDDEVDTSNGTEKLTSKPNLTVNESNAASKGGKRAGKLPGKKRRGTLVLNKSEVQANEESRNKSILDGDEDASNGKEELTSMSNMIVNESDAAISNPLYNELKKVKNQAACFILCGHRLQRKEFQQLIKRLRGKVCRDSHQWSYQASHFVVPEPIRRTEKFFAAAASGSWILKTDYLTASSQAGKFLPEEPYEWHKSALSEDGAISFEAPRKWRLLREKTGHGAFYGMRIVIYGECIAPPLDTLKRVIKAGDGTILATSPPYTRILESGVDFAIVSPGIPRVDIWVQEFLRHQIPCVLADYLVEYVCKPGYSLDRHVQYNTHEWAAKSFSKLLSLSEEVVADAATPPDDQVSDDLACQVCGSTDRGEVMLVCGDESGSTGCGIGTHIDCCDPPLESIPEEDWFCPKCTE